MPANLAGKDFLDNFAASLNDLLQAGARHFFGTAADTGVVGPITWGDLAVMTCLILCALLVNVVVVGYLRHKHRQAVATGSSEMRHHVIRALGQPVYLLIWICGVYLVLTPVLIRFHADEAAGFVRRVFDQGFALGVFVAVFWLFYRFTGVIELRVAALSSRTESKLDDLFVPVIGQSLRVVVPVVGVIFALPMLNLPAEYAGVVSKGTSILLIAAIALIAIKAVVAGEKYVLTRFDIKAADNLQARKVYTQVHVMGKVAYVIIGLFAIASILMLFEEVRRFGTSLLASAGVVGIIIGFAAQKTIANLFAGFQIAMTQPIRLDDVLIVEGEWGRVEEISLTYVILHIWDDRRLVVPLSYFIDKPFQNWTRTSAQLLGSVFVWTDYTLPLGDIRRALKEIIEPHPLWDKRFWNLQVSDATERTMQLRVLATTADSSKGWDLRCAIREQLIDYIQKNYPQCLPRTRAEIAGRPDGKLQIANDE